MPTRDGFPHGRRITRDALNKRLAAPPATKVSGPRVHSRRGGHVITDEEEIFLRITAVGTSPRRYAWREVTHDRHTGVWTLANRTGGLTDDPAFEINDAVLSAGSTIYKATRSRASGAWTFEQGGISGNVDINSGETVLMILGPYEDYDECPGVPPSPPTTFTNVCTGARSTTLCVPAYAYAVYQRCGYVWNKIGDTRTFQVWANEINGGSTSSWYRFHIPRWGGNIIPATSLPDPESACMGVAFHPSSAGALVCSCPTWLSALACLKIRVKWVVEPGSRPVGCPEACWDLMAGRWGLEEETTIDNLSACVLQGDMGPFPVTLTWQPVAVQDCYWGPSVFDPCDPCNGLGTVAIGIGSGTAECGNASNFWMGWRVNDAVLRGLVCDCGTGPIRLTANVPPVGNCGQLAEWVEIECCPEP
jgi:hypothetical protein